MSSSTTPTCTEFQFHKGTIKTYSEELLQKLDGKFQFHKGTIKTRKHPAQRRSDDDVSIP